MNRITDALAGLIVHGGGSIVTSVALKTAKALVTIPRSVLTRADDIIK